MVFFPFPFKLVCVKLIRVGVVCVVSVAVLCLLACLNRLI